MGSKDVQGSTGTRGGELVHVDDMHAQWMTSVGGQLQGGDADFQLLVANCVDDSSSIATYQNTDAVIRDTICTSNDCAKHLLGASS